MRLIQYLQSFFGTDSAGNSRAVYVAGELYPPHAESDSHVVQGIAAEVHVDIDAARADQLADKALDKAVKAALLADEANTLAHAAHAAEALADPNTPPVEGVVSGNPPEASQDASGAAADADVQTPAPDAAA